MKKLILVLGFFLVMPVLVSAASGACSGHGGVNCSAGPDSDGSVVCNDSWRNSSVSYSSMAMCVGYSTSVKESKPVIVTPPPVTPTTKTVTEKPTVIPASKIVERKSEPIKKVEPKIETTPATSKIKTTTQNPAVKLVPETKPSSTPQKKVGFWARVFGFILN